jgi:hypothetical protein
MIKDWFVVLELPEKNNFNPNQIRETNNILDDLLIIESNINKIGKFKKKNES